MKRATLILMLILTMLSGLAAAQMANTPLIAAQVPFAFVAANHAIPAGACTVRSAGLGGNLLLIDCANAKTGLFAAASLVENSKAADAYTLIFHKQGDAYFLRGIKLAGERTAYQFPESKAEAEMRAANVPVTEQIVLASAK